MQLVEKHIVDRDDPRFEVVDKAAFASKNLYNASLYLIRQAYIHEGKYLKYPEMQRRMHDHEAYKALPAKVSQQVLMLLDKNWIAFFKALEAYNEDSSKFTGRPKIPKYKQKMRGRNVLIYTMQAVSHGKRSLDRRIIKPSQLPIEIRTKQDPRTINQVRIVPRNGHYVVEVVYEKAEKQAELNPAYYAGVDMGINNLVALASNKPGFVPALVNGRPVKSINQWYNKRRAELQKQFTRTGTTKRMERLTNKRNMRIEHYMHTTSRMIVDRLVSEGIGTLVIGKNDGWKQEVGLGKRNNQNFVQIPHSRLIAMLKYKAELVGIKVVLTEESYTSAASFLDRDPLPKWKPNDETKYMFSGKRIKRGLYRAADERIINADVNGSLNIIRKVAPKAFDAEGVEDGKTVPASLVVHPVRIVIPRRNQKEKSQALRENVRSR